MILFLLNSAQKNVVDVSPQTYAYITKIMVQVLDNSAYVKVVHDDNVVVYYVKATLILQKQSESTFMMKCDSIEKYYEWSKITEPFTNSIDELLDLIASWNTALSNTFASVNVGTLYFRHPPGN